MFFSSTHLEQLISEGEIVITPFKREQLKGASYTFTLGTKMRIPKKVGEADSQEGGTYDEKEISEEGYVLKPGEFAIFFTQEKIALNSKYVCLISTRGTMAQMGLNISQGSFFCEPDTDNTIALEISNQGSNLVRLYPGIKIAKGIFSGLV